MKLVQDYMMRTLNSVCINDTIAHSIEFMYKSEMSVLPVVDSENNFVGTLYSRKILKNIIPEQYGSIESYRVLYRFNFAAENIEKLKDKNIKDYITTDINAVKETDTMDNVADIMLLNKEQYLFVTNDHNKLRGYISRVDLLYFLLNDSKK